MITDITENKLAKHGSCKDDGRDIPAGRGVFVRVRVNLA
jgi:hypothetical protein